MATSNFIQMAEYLYTAIQRDQLQSGVSGFEEGSPAPVVASPRRQLPFPGAGFDYPNAAAVSMRQVGHVIIHTARLVLDDELFFCYRQLKH